MCGESENVRILDDIKVMAEATTEVVGSKRNSTCGKLFASKELMSLNVYSNFVSFISVGLKKR